MNNSWHFKCSSLLAAIGPRHGNRGAPMTYKTFLAWIVALNCVVLAQPVSFGVNGWEFPLLLKYRPLKRRVSPFLASGPSVSHIGGATEVDESIHVGFPATISPYSRTISSTRPRELARTTTGGIVAATGIDFR